MGIGPIVNRELIRSVRRKEAFRSRPGPVVCVTLVVAACLFAWHWFSWDLESVSGSTWFAHSTFGAILALLSVMTLVMIPTVVGPAIAAERDGKSLDSLLATRLSAAEIVLGSMAAGLIRYLNVMAATVPVITLIVFLGGIDLRLAMLAVAGLVSTAIALSALSAAVSAFAPTAARAVAYSMALTMLWMCAPLPAIVILPRIWRRAAPWIVPVALRMLDGSPLGLMTNVMGVIYRGPLVESVLRMIAYQMAVALVLTVWAIWRLRPASRAIYDAEGRSAILRSLRVRWQRRPPCGEDPVLWHEIHSTRGVSNLAYLVSRILNFVWLGLFLYVTSWYALPAFVELSKQGYGAPAGDFILPQLNPFVRVAADRLDGFSTVLLPGQARLEFNIVLRQVSGILAMLYILMVAGAAAECIVVERERDTWLGLIATPLTGWDILRAKMLGSVWRARGLAYGMLGLWIVALFLGALHPLGFIAGVILLLTSSMLVAAIGTAISLKSRNRGQAGNETMGPMILTMCLGVIPIFWPGTIKALIAAGISLPFLTWMSLFSYEDVRSAIQMSANPHLAAVGIETGADALMALAVGLISMVVQAVIAILVMRWAVEEFDASVGRPVKIRDSLITRHSFVFARRRPGEVT